MSTVSQDHTNTQNAPISLIEEVRQELQEEAQTRRESQLIEQITLEEKQSIIAKLQHCVAGPAGHIPPEHSLYLEQQLSDLLGMTITSEIEEMRLPYSIGTMRALPHLKRHPTDTLKDHQAVFEAGLSPTRSAFGWYIDHGDLLPNSILAERFYISLQLAYLPKWNTHKTTLLSWFKYRKMIVFNPIEEVAVVCCVGDVGPSNWLQYQFGGSPELIRAGRIWGLRSRGKVCVLFVEDPQDNIHLGPIDLRSL